MCWAWLEELGRVRRSNPAGPGILTWPLTVAGPCAVRWGSIRCLLAPIALVSGSLAQVGSSRGSCLPRLALPGLSVAERSRTLDLQPRGLRHTGLGVLNQSQEMDLPYQCGGDTGLAAGVNLKFLPVSTEAASLLPVMPSGPCAQAPIPPIWKVPLKPSWRCSAFPWAIYPLGATPCFPSGQFSVPI